MKAVFRWQLTEKHRHATFLLRDTAEPNCKQTCYRCTWESINQAICCQHASKHSIISVQNAVGDGRPNTLGSISRSVNKSFLYSKLSEPTVGSNRPLAEWVVGALPREIKRPVCEVEQSPHLVSRLRISGAIPLLPYTFMVYIGTTFCFLRLIQ